MRTFTLGTGTERKFVVIELDGPRMRLIKGTADGNTVRSEKELASEAQARAASEKMAAELTARGFVEKSSARRVKAGSSRPSEAKPRAAARASEPEGLDLSLLADGDEAEAEPVLTRLAIAPAAEPEPKKKKAGGKKKKRKKNKEGGADELDKRVIAGIAGVGILFVAFLGYVGYDIFFKPPTIVGHWEGSKLEHEIGRSLSHISYQLVLDGQRNASMTLMEKLTSTGTYAFQGNRLKLRFKDEDGEVSEVEYRTTLGRSTLDLFDPGSGKKVVQLIRMSSKPVATASAPPPAAPKGLAEGVIDKDADARLASVEFAPQDGAFRLRHPVGWAPETGSRPDNMYSWARFTRGSAKVQIFADTAGSLMAGSNQGQYEEGSELAPVHGAHERYKKNAEEMYSDYKESAPGLFKGAGLGEGRVATFTASGGLLVGKLRGLRVTLLTNDRRISILAEAPSGEFEKLKPTFLAICRSLSR